MILVDSSVWIDFFRDQPTRQVSYLNDQLDQEEIAIGDLISCEVLQGARNNRDFNRIVAQFSNGLPIAIADQTVAIEAARHYRLLRAQGITIRRTIDTLIATRCILDDIPLLYSDRDFDPFVQQLGLRSALDDTGVN